MMSNCLDRSRGPDNKRIQFEFSPTAVESLDRIKQETNSSSYAEVVRNALRVYEWVVDVQKKGFELGVVKDDQLLKTVEFLY